MIKKDVPSLFQFNIAFDGAIYEFQVSRVSGRLIVRMPPGVEIPEEVMKMANTLIAVNFRLMKQYEKDRTGGKQLSLF